MQLLLSPAKLALTFTAALWGAAVFADTPTPQKGIAIELNAADLVGEACRVTFVVTNQSQTPVDQAIYETVFFSTSGQVQLLTLFDFGALPAGVPRVRQFQLGDTACNKIGVILINGANTCKVDGQDAPLCANSLNTSSRLPIELKG